MDDETTVAWAALGISIAAMIIALAQAVQQYLITGQLIRLCDSVVFGGLPGQGRRIWQMSQFRFRVMYRVPQIGLPPDLWPSSAAQSFTKVHLSLPRLIEAGPGWMLGEATDADLLVPDTESDREESTRFGIPFQSKTGSSSYANGEVGKASWAAFCRTVYHSCHASIGYSFVEGDADRCPSDIPTVPMQMSLRDAVVMGLMVGMECTAASFDRGSVSMQGAAGTITSAQHPVLGPMIHFTARETSDRLGIGSTGTISKDWLWRVMGNCIVAGRQYNWRRRRWVESNFGCFQKPEVRPDNNDDENKSAFTEEGSHSGSSSSVVLPTTQPKRMPRDGRWQLVPIDPLPPRGHYLARNAPITFLSEDAQPDFRPPMFSWELQQGPGDKARPTYTRMARKHISFETLRVFGYEFELDDKDHGYLIINRWVSEPEQDLLWRHTRELREARTGESGYAASEPEPELIPDMPPSTNGSGVRRRKPPAMTETTQSQQDEYVDDGDDELTKQSTRSKVSQPADSSIHREVSMNSLGTESSYFRKPLRAVASEGASFERGSIDHRSMSRSLDVNWDRRWQQESDGDEMGPGPRTHATSGGTATTTTSMKEAPPHLSSTSFPGHRPPHSRPRPRSRSRSPPPPRPWNSSNRRQEQQQQPPPKMPRSATTAREGDMSWFWLSQTDIIPGFWATPWRSSSIGDLLNPRTCIAAVAVFTEALHYHNHSTSTGEGEEEEEEEELNILRYVPFGNGSSSSSSSSSVVLGDTIAAMTRGVRTWPAYAHHGGGGESGGSGSSGSGSSSNSSSGGGVVCAGSYATVPHPRAFGTSGRIPTVDLLVSHRYQTDQAAATQRSQDACARRIVELMRLDAWLSLVGRMPEIQGRGQNGGGGGGGGARLLAQTPALVQELMLQFQWRFLDADLPGEGEREGESERGGGGGFGVYRRLGNAVVAWLCDKGLSEAETLYVVVAALRTVKVGLAVLTGADTRMLTEIFEKDVQVHLV